MVSCLRNRVLQTRKNRNGDSTTTHYLFSLLLQNNQKPSSSLIKRIRPFSSSSISSKNQSFPSVISYLMNSCGLSEDKAISASKQLHFKTTSRPDSILSLLEKYGFTKPHISKLITKHPLILSSNPYKTLQPKFDFFNSMGLSGLELANFITHDPTLLRSSLKEKIIPVFALLKDVVRTETNVFFILKRSSSVLRHPLGSNLVPNMGYLRDHGVPESNISRLLMTQPRSLLVNPVKFKEIVEEIKGMGFDPLKPTFVVAIHGLASMRKSTLESKLDVFRRWGWSDDQIHKALKNQPVLLTLSEKKIMAAMNFLVNQMGFSPLNIASRPVALMYSLEKRIIPRFSVVRILVSKGLKKKLTLSSVLAVNEKIFLKEFVIKYEQKVPELLQVYQGKFQCLKLPISSKGVGGMNML